jgi:hypothetical protein
MMNEARRYLATRKPWTDISLPAASDGNGYKLMSGNNADGAYSTQSVSRPTNFIAQDVFTTFTITDSFSREAWVFTNKGGPIVFMCFSAGFGRVTLYTAELTSVAKYILQPSEVL